MNEVEIWKSRALAHEENYNAQAMASADTQTPTPQEND